MHMHNWLSCLVKNYSRTVPTVVTLEMTIKPAFDVRPTLTVAVEEYAPVQNVPQVPSTEVPELLAAAPVTPAHPDITVQVQGQDVRLALPTPSRAILAQELPLVLLVLRGPDP